MYKKYVLSFEDCRIIIEDIIVTCKCDCRNTI